MKEFVHAWYSKITSDHTFTDEVIQVIAHCTRALEQRLRHVDVQGLVLDEIPSLIEAHITAYRMAYQSATTSKSKSQLRTAYHALNPHPALSHVPEELVSAFPLEQQNEESIYRQMLAQGLLAILLPTEELENICLRTLVADILADLLLGEIVGERVAEGWCIWEIITKLAEELRPGTDENVKVEQTRKSQLENFGLLSSPTEADGLKTTENQSSLSILLWALLQYAYLAYAMVRFVTLEVAQVASSSSLMPVRGSCVKWQLRKPLPLKPPPLSDDSAVRLPILKYRIFGMASQLVEVPRRMPWLGGSLALAQHVLLNGPGRIGETDGFIDR
ncbi:predicted protein [Uncinocarpus reesii 1704]|uniref:PXA domain-containing protein n=1 Tax=Uncinocarpus reesii (strain UAMH 1704) TaxID=336963 RepID=C4JK64_UNCRE|nr:uncharacterized protein UREG_02021 [Uncinocarpus reesii 1704]EEP77172.1 predicted protein [Uncinocarpus reesii 1704]